MVFIEDILIADRTVCVCFGDDFEVEDVPACIREHWEDDEQPVGGHEGNIRWKSFSVCSCKLHALKIGLRWLTRAGCVELLGEDEVKRIEAVETEKHNERGY